MRADTLGEKSPVVRGWAAGTLAGVVRGWATDILRGGYPADILGREFLSGGVLVTSILSVSLISITP